MDHMHLVSKSTTITLKLVTGQDTIVLTMTNGLIVT